MTGVLFGTGAAIATTCSIAAAVVMIWYVLPIRRAARADIRTEESCRERHTRLPHDSDPVRILESAVAKWVMGTR